MNDNVVQLFPSSIIDRYVLVPKDHLGLLVGRYLFDVGVLDKENDHIEYLNIPVEVDEEDMITIKVGLITGQMN